MANYKFNSAAMPEFDPPDLPDVEEGMKSLTIEDFGENINSNYSMKPEPSDPLKAADDNFTDTVNDINRWFDSCLNFSPTSDQPCVDAMEISSIQPSTSSSTQPVNDAALSDKSPQPPIAMLDDSDAQGKKTKRQRWSPEEHRLFLMGIKRYGEGNWKMMAEEVVKTKTDIQIASHARKHFLRCKSNGSMTDGTAKKKRKSIHDVTINHVPDLH